MNFFFLICRLISESQPGTLEICHLNDSEERLGEARRGVIIQVYTLYSLDYKKINEIIILSSPPFSSPLVSSRVVFVTKTAEGAVITTSSRGETKHPWLG